MPSALQDPAARLTAAIAALATPPTDEGRVVLVVVRPTEGERLTPDRCALTPERGVEGDRWLQREKPLPAAQVSVMRADVARVMANGHALSLFGDNLLVDLDLSAANLPVGTRLQVGSAMCEVTDKPHNGCVKFADRFGQAARDLTGAEVFQSLRLRGIYLRVVEAGEVGPGDRLRVIARPAGAPEARA